MEAYADFIKSITGKIVLLTHSLSGPIGFKLAELLPEKISHLISIEPGLIGNVQETSTPISENDGEVKINFKGFDFNLMIRVMSEPSKQMIDRLTVDCTRRFSSDKKSVDQYIASLQAVHPRLMYERFNIKGCQLNIKSYERLKNIKFLIVTGTEDPVHKDEDYKIVKYFDDHNIKIEHLLLGQKGITGNVHMMMIEDNNEEIAGLICNWLIKNK